MFWVPFDDEALLECIISESLLMSLRCVSLLVVLLLTAHYGLCSGVAPLPDTIKLGNLNRDTFTLSGISSGACMATQFHYAWSSIIKGVGLIAGAPYLCAGGTLLGATMCMETPWLENVELFFDGALTSAALGWIDPIENIANQTVVLFSGTKDTIVPQPNMNNVQLMLEMGGAGAKVRSFFTYPAEHAWITNDFGNACDFLGSPYINNCGFDFSHEFMKTFFTDIGLTFNNTKGTVDPTNLFYFDQTPFGANPDLNSMALEGFLYIPKQCQGNSSSCHLHLNLHGCQQSASFLGTEYIFHTQLPEWAESNNIVLLYPQATANDLLNPDACFDWWGYASETYALKTGPQISAIRSMILSFGGF